jgi:nitrogen fixation NifU-like protein
MDHDLDALYQARILDHFKNPRNREKIPEGHAFIEKHNPICGDVIKVALDETAGVIQRLFYDVQACAICVASASMMSEAVSGKPITEVVSFADEFIALIASDDPITEESFGDLAAMESVKRYPMRLGCATLSWKALSELG